MASARSGDRPSVGSREPGLFDRVNLKNRKPAARRHLCTPRHLCIRSPDGPQRNPGPAVYQTSDAEISSGLQNVIYAGDVIFARSRDGAQRNPRPAVHQASEPRISSGLQDVIYASDVIFAWPQAHSVVPGRREAASPEPITPGFSDQSTTGEYGFRAPAFGRPRNDGCGLWNARSSMQSTARKAGKTVRISIA
jgi:hypothetical protein